MSYNIRLYQNLFTKEFSDRYVSLYRSRTQEHIDAVKFYFKHVTLFSDKHAKQQKGTDFYFEHVVSAHDSDKLRDDSIIRAFGAKYAANMGFFNPTEEQKEAYISAENSHRSVLPHHVEYYFNSTLKSNNLGNMSFFALNELISDWLSCAEENGNDPVKWAEDHFRRDSYMFQDSQMLYILERLVYCKKYLNSRKARNKTFQILRSELESAFKETNHG